MSDKISSEWVYLCKAVELLFNVSPQACGHVQDAVQTGLAHAIGKTSDIGSYQLINPEGHILQFDVQNNRIIMKNKHQTVKPGIPYMGDTYGDTFYGVKVNWPECETFVHGLSGLAIKTNTEKKPSHVSKAALVAWYKQRIRECVTANEKPTEDDDMKAARSKFKQAVTRQRVRELRHRTDLGIPEEWQPRKRGKKPGGMKPKI